MHEQNGDRFQIPHSVLKRHIDAGMFVELRIDSARFSAHPDAPEKCTCPHCNEEASKPILTHEQPATLLELPKQDVPSRGWGEDFWVQVVDREGKHIKGRIDNPLYEARLHELHQDDEIVFHEDHILAVHGLHRMELVSSMNASELQELAAWIESQS
ncbi:MAG: hypothetical protein CMJ78_11395 [Planctomycetaceae bacterium]|nr:hypothetical protein [Planctomycetaceae bacterium]